MATCVAFNDKRSHKAMKFSLMDGISLVTDVGKLKKKTREKETNKMSLSGG